MNHFSGLQPIRREDDTLLAMAIRFRPKLVTGEIVECDMSYYEIDRPFVINVLKAS